MRTKFSPLLFILMTFFYSFSQNSEPKLLLFETSECQPDHNMSSLQDRIVSQKFEEDIFSIHIELIANCCFGDLGSIEVKNDTLKLFFRGKPYPLINEKGEITGYSNESLMCDCDCCFNFKYSIKGLEKKDYVVLANNKEIHYSPYKYKTFPVKYDIVNGERINYFDIYGFKQGIHRRIHNNKVLSELEYVDNKPMNGIYHRQFYESGEKMIEIHMKNGEFVKKIEFHKNGTIKKDCEIKKTFDPNAICIEFDENGKEIK